MKSPATTQQGVELRTRPRVGRKAATHMDYSSVYLTQSVTQFAFSTLQMLASASRACGLIAARSAMGQSEIFGRSLLRPVCGLGLGASRSFLVSPLAAAAADKEPAAKQVQQKQPKGNAAKGGKAGGRGKGKESEDSPQGGCLLLS